MEQLVFVIAVEHDEATVCAERASACGQCAGKAACSTLGSWSKRTMQMRAKNPVGARVGDEVMIYVPDSWVLKAAFRLYGVPMLAFFLAGTGGWLLGGWLEAGSRELWAAVFGLAGVLAAYAAIYASERSSQGGGLHASITRIKQRAGDVPIHEI